MSFIDSCLLNKEQMRAAKHTEGPLLVLAGAGSGKTRVLTHRIAHMILDEGIPAYSILAITFTNKAAGEMKERVERMVGEQARNAWIMTFHSCCVRILRGDIHNLGYTESFTIFDDTDTQSLISKLLKENAPYAKLTPKSVKDFISGNKNKMISYERAAENAYDAESEFKCDIYKLYDEELKRNNALDFDDLLNLTVELFQSFPEVLEKYRERFEYILVDEYQDTNKAQYLLVKMLGKKHQNVCVVGDDDQSIYGWRGANYQNIFAFEKDFPKCAVIKLEQNYRSSGNILRCANSVIENNSSRKPKKLWTEAEAGEKVHMELLYDDQSEAVFVTDEILRLSSSEFQLCECAVLYRTNAIGRVVQKVLARKGVAFDVYGDVSFYKRKEIKDAFAYLRLLVNPNDEVALLRVINEPKRGIGDVTVDEIAAYARKHNETMFGYILDAEEYNELPQRTKKKLEGFSTLIKSLIMISATAGLTDIMRAVVGQTGLKAQYMNKDNIEDLSRVENLEALVSDAAEYQGTNEGGTLFDYLESVSLASATDTFSEQGAVKLMTLHSAKGLEFPAVFIMGMEQGIFPLERARNYPEELEEERRLCYVGITRAKRLLYLTSARMRMKNGMEMRSFPSEFLLHIPRDIIVSNSMGDFKRQEREREVSIEGSRSFWINKGMRLEPKEIHVGAKFSVSDRVRHKTFGDGVVVFVRQTEKRLFLSIKFDSGALKELDASIAPIERVE